MCPLLKPVWYDYFSYVFHTGDQILAIYFLQKGEAEFVLPRYNNQAYISLKAGNHFGLIDFVGSSYEYKFELD